MTNQRRALIVGALLALAAIVVAVVVLADSDSKDKPDTTTTSTEATTTSTTQPATTTSTQAAATGFATPEDAIRAYVENQGHEYAGDCGSTSLESDVGKWCSGLGADNGDTRTYYIGPTFSEGAEQLTLTRGTSGSGAGRWTVTAHEPIPPVGEGI